MTVSMWGELLFLLLSLLFGVGLGGLYSLLRITRMLIGVRYPEQNGGFRGISLPLLADKTAARFLKRKREGALFLPVFLGDLFFFLTFAFAYSIFLYAMHSGVFRLYSLLGVCGGFFLWDFTLGRLLLRFSAYVLFVLYAIRDYLCYFIFLPIFRLLKHVFRAAGCLARKNFSLLGNILAFGVNTFYHPLWLRGRDRKLQKLLKEISVYEKSKG